jgi:nicotinate-nucleotide adenylyltransferase
VWAGRFPGHAVTVGLLGGAFDPPHVGHVALAKAAVQDLDLDRLVVVVVGAAPHKHVETDAETRFRLAEAAFATLENVELSRHELEREGLSYTVDTARWASEELGDAVFVVGADEFADFLSWKDPDGVLRHVRLAVATRPGYPRERLEDVRARLATPDRVQYFQLPPIPASSRDVRARVAAGLPIDDLVPAEVARLIAELGLYRPGSQAKR